MSKDKALTKIKGSFAKRNTGLNISEVDVDPYSQLHGEYYTLDGIELSQAQAMGTCAPKEAADVGTATKRGDLEYGHQGS